MKYSFILRYGIACLFYTLVPGSLSAAPTDYVVSGHLCDSLTREPEAFATVRLLRPGQSVKVVLVATTSEKGYFSMKVPQSGNYMLEAVVLGKQPVRRKLVLNLKNHRVDTDTMFVKEYTSTLGMATITAQKPLVKAEIDKLTYSMADDPEAQTNTTLEMLRKVPMVTVDGEDNVKVNGNSNFQVFVNGKPNKMMTDNPSAILKDYPASVIKKIEVITNPGAKYDAEGVAGVLNIITKSETQTKGYMITPRININERGWGAGVHAMAQVGKLMLSAHYGAGETRGKSKTDAEREVYADPLNHQNLQNDKTRYDSFFQYGNLDASYEFTPRDLLSVSVGLYGGNTDSNREMNSRMFNVNGEQVYSYGQRSHTDSHYISTDFSADFQHTFKENQYITFSYRYALTPQYERQHIWFDKVQNVPEGIVMNDLRTDPDKRTYEHTAQVDFTTSLGKRHTLSAGAKYIYRINRSNNKEWFRPVGSDLDFAYDSERSLRYRHRGDVASLYAEYIYKYNNWSLQAGNRYEYFSARVSYPDGKRSSFRTHMGDWVPSFTVGYALKPSMMLKAGYNMRLSRPSISSLSPYVVQVSPEVVTHGNPNLGSSKVHNFNLNFSSFGPKFTLNTTLSHKFSNNQLVRYSYVENNVMHQTNGNFLKSKVTTLSAYINWTIVNGTVLNINASGWYVDYKSKRSAQHNSGFAASVWGSLRQDLPWRIKCSIGGGGNSRGVELQGLSPAYYHYYINLSRSFLKDDRLTLSVSASNFFNRYHYFRNETQTDTFRWKSVSRRDFMNIRVGVRYRIGSLRAAVKRVARSIHNNDVDSQPLEKGEGNGGM